MRKWDMKKWIENGCRLSPPSKSCCTFRLMGAINATLEMMPHGKGSIKFKVVVMITLDHTSDSKDDKLKI